MALAVAATSALGPSSIAGAGSAAISYPGFFADLERLRD
jgi:5-enolpyruvylshikimate-3-phosphate synthase